MSVTLRAKVAVLGDRAVGKTALTQMFQSKGKLFPKNYKLTGGMDVVVAPVPIEGTKATVELYVCDVSGHEMFGDMLPQLLENVNLVILVYDQSSRESFEACAASLRVLNSSNKGKTIQGVLVGNKHDLVGQVSYDADGDGEVTAKEVAAANEKLGKLRQREVSLVEAKQWAESRHLVFMETSALPPGTAIDAPFKWCAKTFHTAYEERLEQLTKAA
uniref:EF-hand domain-containing protein n=1 Tax=Mantoniella antarctica TaxID=81844 RepID=A0A7S0SS64_9CHLO|mmetsp:Transcript_13844/g.22658  ORF Transcript_13844/g.22658 Transcript_13844/m.22658 type:complete len:217 (-) Transcript_13844:839-1489(-)|eukprot:CAMPEP_0198703388 /NCGR_PEP_ID=MMETSP1468-20131203/389317_1 /TAXON_ID=1461545 /ORGANISM="Mantoniella sp, Strain CCMP1436" /LENGTH=216 /DNA_ID=CAMNT_0044462081 /DNA_START=3890 /DNA_END=4540 /DNA_ORIENTATION=+